MKASEYMPVLIDDVGAIFVQKKCVMEKAVISCSLNILLFC